MSWLDFIEGLQLGGSPSRPSPHKPLLLVYLLGRAARGADNGIAFEEFEQDFRPWLQELTDSATVDPRLPFWHLQADGNGIWRVEPTSGYEMQAGRNRPKASSLKAIGARGHLSDALWSEVANMPARARQLAQTIVDRWLPDAGHRQIAMRRFDEEARTQQTPQAPITGQPWQASEYLPLIEAYMGMLTMEIADQAYSKAAVRRELVSGPLAARSEGACEMKMSNVSSILFDTRKRWIKGYRPLANRQRGPFVEAVLAATKRYGIPHVDLSTHDRETLDEHTKLILSSDADLSHPPGNPAPQKRMVAGRMQVVRDPEVVAHVLRRANGTCEACQSPAPFRRKKGATPFLEVHHLKMLSDDGPDTVANACAVCPNCHRELHHGENAEQIKQRALSFLAQSD